MSQYTQMKQAATALALAAVPASAALAEIEAACKRATEAAEDLSGAITDLRAAIEPSIARAMPRIRELLIQHRANRKAVEDLVSSHRALFAKPRTRIYHGVKVGLQALPEQLMLEDKDDALIARIDRELPDAAALLAPTSREVSIAAVKLLPDADLARIGGVRVDGETKVVVKLPLDPEDAVRALLGPRAELAGEVKS
jgi:hypothetical protein